MGQPRKKRENKRISRSLKQGAEWANLSKKEKTNGLVGAEHRGLAGQPKEEKKTNGLVGAKKQGSGRANLRKKEKTNGLVGGKNRGRGGLT